MLIYAIVLQAIAPFGMVELYDGDTEGKYEKSISSRVYAIVYVLLRRN